MDECQMHMGIGPLKLVVNSRIEAGPNLGLLTTHPLLEYLRFPPLLTLSLVTPVHLGVVFYVREVAPVHTRHVR